jgi:hypothetical protein
VVAATAQAAAVRPASGGGAASPWHGILARYLDSYQ